MFQRALNSRSVAAIFMFIFGVIFCILALSMRRAPKKSDEATTLDTALQKYLHSTDYSVSKYQNDSTYIVNGTTLVLTRLEDKSFQSLGSVFGEQYPVIITHPVKSVPLEQLTLSLYDSGYTGTYRISDINAKDHTVTLRDIDSNKTFSIQFYDVDDTEGE